MWPQIAVSVLFAYLIAHTFIGVYSMAIDTIFLCFCEDCSRNDGINKPYYMSRVQRISINIRDNFILMFQELMQFVENSKKALEALERKNMKQTESKQVWKVAIFRFHIKLSYYVSSWFKREKTPSPWWISMTKINN